MSGNTRDLIQRYIYVFGLWEPTISEWISGFLRPGDVALDIGANVGYMSLLAADRVGPTGQVVSFEPVPSLLQHLKRNIGLNPYGNIDVLGKIASDENGQGEIFKSNGYNSGMSGTVGGSGHRSEGRIEKVRITDVLERKLWPRLRLVKIDTEGDEMKVLVGLGPVLDVMVPGSAVVVEITPDQLAARGSSASELVDFLVGRGFVGYLIGNSYDPASYLNPARPVLEPLRDPPIRSVDTVFVRGER